jgi:hypothetical protein
MSLINNQIISIGVAMHNNAETIHRCLSSIINQKNLKRKISIILANDNSSDNWKEKISDLLKDNRIIQLNLNNSDVVKTRNAINDYIINNLKEVVLICRLDADDEYADNYVLSKIEEILDKENPEAIVSGNYLRLNGKIIERKNYAVKEFRNINYILKRLKLMSENVSDAELPSCNLILTPKILKPYPNIKSGEDHYLLTYYLMNQDKYKIFLADNLLLTIFSLGGAATTNNQKSNIYLNCRKELYKRAVEFSKDKNTKII